MRYELNHDYMHLKDFILDVDGEFNRAASSIHKARNEIKCIGYKGSRYIVKSFKVPNLFRRSIYTFIKPSKAKKSYLNSKTIKNFAPLAIAYVELLKSNMIDKSFFISEEFKYDFTIREPLLDREFSDKKTIFKEFAIFTCKLHSCGIYHLDYSPGNILIKKEASGYRFQIVDINRVKFFNINLKNRLKNFSKLWADDEDLSYIVKEYAKAIGEDEQECIKTALHFSNRHKKIANLKKRLKGEKIAN